MNVKKFRHHLNGLEQPFHVSFVNRNPVTRVLEIGVTYEGEPHGKLRPFKWQQEQFYGNQSKAFVVLCSREANAVRPKVKGIRVRYIG